MELRNTELIEQIAYNYDDNVKEKSSLPSVFLNSEEELSSESGSESEHSTGEEHTEDDLMRDVTIKLGPVVALQKKSGLDEDAVNFGRSSWFVDLQQEGGNTSESSNTGVFLPPSVGVMSGVEWGNESVAATGSGVTSGVSVGVSSSSGVGSTEVLRTSVIPGVLGEEGVGGKGWMEGVKGSAMATATGFFQLIQNRPATEIPHASGSKTDYLTRHSLNFDMKFHPPPSTTITASSSQQTTQGSFDGKLAVFTLVLYVMTTCICINQLAKSLILFLSSLPFFSLFFLFLPPPPLPHLVLHHGHCSISDDMDCHLSGHWKELWESQIYQRK